MSRELGITDAQLAAVGDHASSDLFSPVEKLVLDLAVAMTATPADVPERLREDLRAHLTSAQLTELCAVVAWENHRARLNRALGVREMGFSEGAYCVLPQPPLDR